MDWNKIPRWMLIALATLGLGACGILVSTARADLDKFKTIAYNAKNTSDQNARDIAEVKESVKGIKDAQEQWRREYREDNKEMVKALSDISRAVKA